VGTHEREIAMLHVSMIQYGITAAILLLNVDTACQEAVGGTGC
jgi:hypothetical protein